MSFHSPTGNQAAPLWLVPKSQQPWCQFPECFPHTVTSPTAIGFFFFFSVFSWLVIFLLSIQNRVLGVWLKSYKIEQCRKAYDTGNDLNVNENLGFGTSLDQLTWNWNLEGTTFFHWDTLLVLELTLSIYLLIASCKYDNGINATA